MQTVYSIYIIGFRENQSVQGITKLPHLKHMNLSISQLVYPIYYFRLRSVYEEDWISFQNPYERL